MTGSATKKLNIRGTLDTKVSPYLFVLPFLLLFALFGLTPVIMNLVLSFLKWDYSSPAEFVGFKNFQLIFNLSSNTGSKFWASVLHTLLFVAVETPILILVPFFIACLLNLHLAGSKIARAAIYFPCILSISTVAIIFFVLLDTNAGVINMLFGADIPWLTQQPEQWISIFILSSWWGLGGNMILFTAGMQKIPADIYEAAKLDGCNTLQTMVFITLPELKDTFVYVIITTILSTFNVMGQPMMLTAGEESTTVVMQYIYGVAFGGWNLGRASAMSVIVAIIMSVFSLAAYKFVFNGGKAK